MQTLFAYTRLVRAYWPMLAFGIFTVFWGNLGQSFFISWYGSHLQATFGLSASAYGSLYSGATLLSGFCLLLLGGSIDRIPLRWFATLVALGLMAGALLMWQASAVWMLVPAIFLLRFAGQGMMPHTAMTTMARYFSASRGKAISVAANGVPLGEMILPLGLVALIGWVGWQQSWLVLALTLPLLYLPLAWWLLHRTGPAEAMEERPQTDVSGVQKPAPSRRTMLRDRRFWFALPAVLYPGFAITGVFIQQGFITQARGWSPELFATSFLLYGAMHWLASMWVGNLVDRFTAARLFRWIPIPLVAGFALTAVIHSPIAVWLMMATLGASIGLSGPIVGALWAEVYGTTHLGSIRSLITAIGVTSTAAAPLALGAMIDAGMGVNSVFAVLAAFGLIVLIMAQSAYRPETASS